MVDSASSTAIGSLRFRTLKLLLTGIKRTSEDEPAEYFFRLSSDSLFDTI